MSDFVGIDLGTTFSAVASVNIHGKPVVLYNSLGKPITPSVIFLGEGGPIIGEEAKEYQALGHHDVAFMFKRRLGDVNFVLHLGGCSYNATQLSALLLKKLVEDAQQSLGRPIKRAVITVPAYFDNHQRQATIEAGQSAGLNVMRIINEPTAAALAYGFGNQDETSTLLVYDLGGGTFDVSIVRIGNNSIDVLGTSGDHELGGRDWDDRLANYVAQQFEDAYGINPLAEWETASDLLVRCEIGKKQLSDRNKTNITIAHQGDKGSYEISRETFEILTRDLMERTTSLSEQTLEEVGLNWDGLDGVLLVGGSTRMPMVHKYVTTMSGKPPRTGVNVDEAVALGAALQAASDAQPGKLFALPGMRKFVDVMSHSLGMVATDESNSKYINSMIIPKNRPIPCIEKRTFKLRTGKRVSNEAEVYVLQGESVDPTTCSLLGKYTFAEIAHEASGTAVLDISYAYDENGVVIVNATQRSTGKELPKRHEAIPDDMSWLAHPPVLTRRKQQQHLTLAIAIDLSGSMAGKPLQEAQKAAKKFIEDLDLNHTSIGLIAFADKARCTCDLDQDAHRLESGIDAWAALMEKKTIGCSNFGDPFGEAKKMLSKAKGPASLIVLTDGCWANSQTAIDNAKVLHEAGIEIIALGFGTANGDFLKAIATCDENALFTNLSELGASFSKIAQVLSESGDGITTSDGSSGKRLRIFS